VLGWLRDHLRGDAVTVQMYLTIGLVNDIALLLLLLLVLMSGMTLLIRNLVVVEYGVVGWAHHIRRQRGRCPLGWIGAATVR